MIKLTNKKEGFPLEKMLKTKSKTKKVGFIFEPHYDNFIRFLYPKDMQLTKKYADKIVYTQNKRTHNISLSWPERGLVVVEDNNSNEIEYEVGTKALMKLKEDLLKLCVK